MTLVSVGDKGSYSGLENFDCGIPALNEYLTKYAFQNDKKGIGKTFLGIEDQKIVGFFTLSTAQVKLDCFPEDDKRLIPRYPIPAIRIARLAVMKNSQRKGYGRVLLKEAFTKILVASQSVGIYLVIVDAKDEAKPFYEHFGFRKLKTVESTYFLMVDTIRKAAFSSIKTSD